MFLIPCFKVSHHIESKNNNNNELRKIFSGCLGCALAIMSIILKIINYSHNHNLQENPKIYANQQYKVSFMNLENY